MTYEGSRGYTCSSSTCFGIAKLRQNILEIMSSDRSDWRGKPLAGHCH